MASAFAHALLAVTLGKDYPRKGRLWKFLLLGAFCAVIPDADVVMFKLGVPYEHFLGHRGLSHSLVFSLLLGVLLTRLFYRGTPLTSRAGLALISFFFLCTASHILLDALTNGGLGVAVFSPFDNTRYFLPWRPIQVSPIGAGKFFSERGLAVLKSEAVWVGLPCLAYVLAVTVAKKLRR
ncbi:metal-dependent hydrolase [Rufibacter immobilis]|uniref:metal-dependent hydrolase n=1 Tax=Rufibacter immobilis TaxID=1348778 RepID=UPI0035E88537